MRECGSRGCARFSVDKNSVAEQEPNCLWVRAWTGEGGANSFLATRSSEEPNALVRFAFPLRVLALHETQPVQFKRKWSAHGPRRRYANESKGNNRSHSNT